jgi:hypothetical protein
VSRALPVMLQDGFLYPLDRLRTEKTLVFLQLAARCTRLSHVSPRKWPPQAPHCN